MEVKAKSKYIRMSARKVRLAADLVRGLKAQSALAILSHLNKKAAEPLLATLKQGVANAVNNFNLNKDSLIIKGLEIGEGPTLKRGRPVSRGRWHPIFKRTSHIMMTLEGQAKQKKKKLIKKKNKSK